MKLDKVIMSCDDNPNYFELWKYVSKVCKLSLGITPVLFHITNENTDIREDEFGLVKKVKKIEGISSSFQSQLYRLYGTKFFHNENLLISDVDMFIFDKEYFLGQVSEIDDNSFISYLSDAYDLSRPDTVNMYGLNRIPMCYLASKSEVFSELLEIKYDFSDFVDKVYNYDFGYEVPEFHRDEVYVGKMMMRNHKNIKLEKLKRGIENVWRINKRIEKEQFYQIDFSSFERKEVVDCHIPSNYSENMDYFHKVINQILIHN
jgi:hypothetical protein